MTGAFQLVLMFGLCCFGGEVFATRRYSKTLRVTNGGDWGDWRYKSLCPRGSYAIGYEMKIEAKQGRGDDTSLNGVQLICGDRSGQPDGSTAASGVGEWVDWEDLVVCFGSDVITGFKLQVEGYQGPNVALGDDTAANFMQIRCRAFEASDEGYAMYPGTGYGYWGSYGNWSESCVPGTAVCGIRTRIERPQGGGNADDTTLNDLELYCCGLD